MCRHFLIGGIDGGFITAGLGDTGKLLRMVTRLCGIGALLKENEGNNTL